MGGIKRIALSVAAALTLPAIAILISLAPPSVLAVIVLCILAAFCCGIGTVVYMELGD